MLYQTEARRYALGCASLPLAPVPMFLMLGVEELVEMGENAGMFGFMGILVGVIILLMGLCELLCFWLGSSERKLNYGKPYELDPNALSWASEAYELSKDLLEKRTNAAITLALLVVPSFLVSVILQELMGSDFWMCIAFAAPLALTSGAVFVRSHASRMNRCYQHLLECAQKENPPDSTDG